MSNKKIFSLFLIVFLAASFFPAFVWAGEYKTSAGAAVSYPGLVPCGGESCVNVSDETIKTRMKSQNISFSEACSQSGGQYRSPASKNAVPCQLCHAIVMFKGIVDFTVALVIIIAVLLITIAGAYYISSMGSPSKLQKAQSIITSVAIGLIVIFGAWMLVNAIFAFLGLSSFSLGFTGPAKWFNINCPIKI